MSESTIQLMEKMRVSREALAQKLRQRSPFGKFRSPFPQRLSITPERIGIAVCVALAITVLFPAGRRRARTRAAAELTRRR
jgi:hypothetical protein